MKIKFLHIRLSFLVESYKHFNYNFNIINIQKDEVHIALNIATAL
jgi:hypothetical protein